MTGFVWKKRTKTNEEKMKDCNIWLVYYFVYLFAALFAAGFGQMGFTVLFCSLFLLSAWGCSETARGIKGNYEIKLNLFGFEFG